jgi:nicotinamidase/pyrazinamidase
MAYTLLIIDPQRDFHEGGSLAVTGATADSERISALIAAAPPAKTVVSLDTHTPLHVGHSGFWVDKDGNHPNPFTGMSVEGEIIISRTDKGVATHWMPVNPEHNKWALYYVENLPKTGRGAMLVWPNHCLEGTDGHLVHAGLKAQLETLNQSTVQYYMKGQNEATEMYSIFKAELPVEGNMTAPQGLYSGGKPAAGTGASPTKDVVTTSFLKTDDNTALVDHLAEGGLPIVVCGQALSHCVNWSTRDLKRLLGPRSNRIILLIDGSSPVGTFEDAASKFVKWCGENGVEVKTTEEVKAEFAVKKKGGARRNRNRSNKRTRNNKRNNRRTRNNRRQ